MIPHDIISHATNATAYLEVILFYFCPWVTSHGAFISRQNVISLGLYTTAYKTGPLLASGAYFCLKVTLCNF